MVEILGQSEVELKDRVESIDKMVVLNVEESYLETLKNLSF